jgi:hypothetical protein
MGIGAPFGIWAPVTIEPPLLQLDLAHQLLIGPHEDYDKSLAFLLTDSNRTWETWWFSNSSNPSDQEYSGLEPESHKVQYLFFSIHESKSRRSKCIRRPTLTTGRSL